MLLRLRIPMEKITVHICKANPIREESIPNVEIIVDEHVPDSDLAIGQNWEKRLEDFYGGQAKRIEDALYHCLPQGTYDRLAINFMRRKVSLYAGKEKS